MVDNQKQRIIQEFVPGRQVTLAHIITSLPRVLYAKLGLFDGAGAIGIFTITPSEATMNGVLAVLCGKMGYTPTPITRT